MNRFDPGLLVVVAISIIAIWPFISRPGLPQGTDAELHIFRLAELSYLIRGGEIYPRWAPNFYHGYGYPIFNYYAPLTYYVGLVFDLMPRLGPVEGVKAVFILGLLAAAWGMYGFVRDNWGRPAGYVAAASYLYAPYIQYIDPHARGALAEAFSFGVFPLALWALDRLRRQSSPWNWLAAVISVAAVVLAHNLMGLLFFGLLLAWAGWQVASGRWQVAGRDVACNVSTPATSHQLPAASLPLLALFLGLGLAAFFWLPVILERNAVNLNTLIGQGDNFDFRTHFLTWTELLAFSKRLDWGSTEPVFYFNLGVAQWLLGGLGIILLLARKARPAAHLTFFTLLLAAILFLMLPVSIFLWQAVPLLPFFQFPWRLMGAAAAALAVLAGAGTAALLDSGPDKRPHKANDETGRRKRSRQILSSKRFNRAWLTAVFVALPLLLALPLSQPAPWPDFGEVSALRMTLIELRGRWLGTTSTADYVPVTVDMIPRRNEEMVKAFHEGRPLDRVNRVAIPEQATVETEFIRPLYTRYYVSTPENFRLRLYQFDFPGWTVRLDGRVIETEVGRPEGFIVIPVPAGRHVIDVEFGSTPARTLAGVVTGLSLVLAAAVAWRMAASRRLRPFQGKPEAQPHRADAPLGEAEGWQGAGGQGKSASPGEIRPYAYGDWAVLGAVLGVTAVHLLLLEPGGWLHDSSTGLMAEPAKVDVFADFGRQIALIGYDTPAETAAPGQAVEVTLYWKAEQPIDINYQAFLHLLASDGALVAQSDKLNPGEFPTRQWPLDKYVSDVHRLEVPPDLPPGDYSVAVGLWVQSEGWRLPLLDESGRQISDHYMLFRLTVVDR